MTATKKNTGSLLFDIIIIGIVAVMISLGFAGLFFSYSFNRDFEKYVKKTEVIKDHQITKAVEEIGASTRLLQRQRKNLTIWLWSWMYPCRS